MYRFTLIPVLFLLLVLSCSPIERQPVVLIEDETVSHQLWSSLVHQNPLPDGIALSTTGGSSIDNSESQQVIAHLRIFHQKATDSENLPSAESLLLKSTYYVPVVPFWDPRNNIELNRAAELPLFPIEEVKLPQKALSVDGLRIDSPEYPFVEKSFLELKWIESTGASTAAPAIWQAKDSLSRWFTRLSKLTEYTDISSPTTSSGSPELVWIGGVGDMMLQRGVQELLIHKGIAGMHTVFQDTLPVLQQQDLLIGNLEGAVTRHGEPVPKSYNFRFLPQVLPWLREAGFDYLSITNNHCYDFGSRGFLDTLHYLEEYGLLTSGAGRTPQEAYTPVEISIKGTDITVLSAAAYPQEKNGFDGRSQAQVTDSRPGIIFSGPRVLETLRRISSPDSIDIMVAHGGEEWHSSPSEEQQQFYRAGIDAGADIVFAHHPHVLQGMEAYKGGLIAYSLGNFIFPGMYEMLHAEESMILSAGFYDGQLLYLQPYPVDINHRFISLAPPNSPILPRFLKLTRQLN